MKKVKLLFIACLLGAAFAFTSCQSAATVQKDSVGQIPLSNSNYEILGRLKVVEENTVFIGFGAPLTIAKLSQALGAFCLPGSAQKSE